MAETFLLEIVTPSRKLLSKEVDEVVAPGFNGEFGVLPGHTQFLTVLKPGEITFKKGPETESYAVGRGYAEVLPDKTTVLVDTAESKGEIDIDKAKKTLAEAEEALKRRAPEDAEYAATTDAYELAAARIKVKER